MKTSKLPVIIAITIILGLFQSTHAQQATGLYLAPADFINHKLSYTTDADKPSKTRIILHYFLDGKNVTVKANGQKLNFRKDEIFGYHDISGKDYRFYHNKAYQVVDSALFFIYSAQQLVQQGKGPKPTTVYYFSTKSNDKIYALTAANIIEAFPENIRFKYMVGAASRLYNAVSLSDDGIDAHKLKEVYRESLK